MAPGSCAYCSLYVNTPADLAREQDELAGTQSPAKESNIGSNKTNISLKAPTPLFVPLSTKNLCTKFMKVFIKTT